MPSIFTNLRSRIANSIKGFLFNGLGGVPSGNTGTIWGEGFRQILPGTNLDYRREAGLLWQNTVILAIIHYIGRAAKEAPLVVKQWSDDKEGDIIKGHGLSKLFQRPNPYYTGRDMRQAIVTSLVADGNAYLFKVRSKAGKVVQLYYTPHFMVEPRWPSDGSQFITFYEYRVGGKSYPVAVEDVIHLRNGIDPLNNRKGLGPISAALREVATLNKAATYAAALMANSGVVSVIIAPKNIGVGGEGEFQEGQAKDIKRDFRRMFRGDMTGDAMVMEVPLEVHKPNYSPEELALDILLDRPELNLHAAAGVDCMLTGIKGGEGNRTYANYGEALDAFWTTTLLPMLGDIAAQLDQQALDDFGSMDTEECCFDVSGIRALQPDKTAEWKRWTDAWNGGGIKRSEYKAGIGVGEVDEAEDDVYKTDIAPPIDPNKPEPSDEGNDAPPAKKPIGAGKEAIASRWRTRQAGNGVSTH